MQALASSSVQEASSSAASAATSTSFSGCNTLTTPRCKRTQPCLDGLTAKKWNEIPPFDHDELAVGHHRCVGGAGPPAVEGPAPHPQLNTTLGAGDPSAFQAKTVICTS